MAQKSRSLTSAKNPVVQRFRDAAAGKADGLMVAEGVRLLWDAVRAGAEVVEVAVSPKLADVELRDALAERAASFLDVSDALLQRLSALDTSQAVAAILRRPVWDDGALLGDELAPLVVAAAGLRDPGNVGAVLRSAEAAGATGCLTLQGGADPFREKAVRGSMGSIFRLPVRHGLAAADALAFARRQRLQVVVADGRGAVPHTVVDLRRPTLLVIGAEAAGVDSQWLEAADQHVRIPLRAPVESLNAAVAAGVLLFEAQRQRVDA
jgi:TrmH family RNA methyltransferase